MFKPIETSSNNRGRFLLLGFLIALALLIMISDQLGFLRPAQQLTGVVLNPVESAINHLGQNLNNSSAFFSDLEKLRQENATLRLELQKANAYQGKIADMANQIDVLKRQVQFYNNPLNKNLTPLPADVIDHDTTGQNQTITINRGSNDGIKRGKPVLDPSGYLVGRIAQVWSDKSMVMLITDNSVAVNVSTQRYINEQKVDTLPADGTAVGEWQTGGRISMLHIKPDADVKPGDYVFTNGVGGTFPPNIFVGQLGTVTKIPGQAEQQAILNPAVDLSHLSQVLVLLNS